MGQEKNKRIVSKKIRVVDEGTTIDVKKGSEVLSVIEREMLPVLYVLEEMEQKETEKLEVLIISDKETKEGYDLTGFDYVGKVSLRRNWYTHHVFVKKN